jgi:2-keto-4-pentenoate hydratase
MEKDRVAAAAAALKALREEKRVVTALPDGLAPASVAEGYAVQDAFIACWPDQVVGWKVGATAAAVQEKFGLSEPFSGPVFARDVQTSPAAPVARDFPHLCLESEFAFRFTRSLPARAQRYERAEIIAALGALVPAFELIGPRFDSLLSGRAPMAIADCGVNAGLVLGVPVDDWQGYDLPNHRVVLQVEGVEVAAGSGANVLGDPIKVLEWAVNHLSTRGIGLEAGQLISTGTTTGLSYVRPGQRAVADFGALGQVEAVFAGPPHPDAVPPPQ